MRKCEKRGVLERQGHGLGEAECQPNGSAWRRPQASQRGLQCPKGWMQPASGDPQASKGGLSAFQLHLTGSDTGFYAGRQDAGEFSSVQPSSKLKGPSRVTVRTIHGEVHLRALDFTRDRADVLVPVAMWEFGERFESTAELPSVLRELHTKGDAGRRGVRSLPDAAELGVLRRVAQGLAPHKQSAEGERDREKAERWRENVPHTCTLPRRG